MGPLEETLRHAAAELDRARARWALVGGLAVAAQAEPRYTRVIDLAVSVARDADAEELVAAFVAAGYQTLAIVEQAEAGRLATVRLQPPGEPRSGLLVDLIFATCGIETEIVANAELMPVLSGFRAPVARVEHLIAMKVLAQSDVRAQDRMDLHALVKHAEPAQIEGARKALRLVSERGFAREKDLLAELDRVVADVADGSDP